MAVKVPSYLRGRDLNDPAVIESLVAWRKWRSDLAADYRAHRAEGKRCRLDLHLYKVFQERDDPFDDLIDGLVEWLDERYGEDGWARDDMDLWLPNRNSAFEFKMRWG